MMNINIFNSIVIAGIIQGLIFVGIVLSSKKYRYKSIFYLAALMLTYSLSNLEYLLADVGVMTYGQMYTYIWFPFASLMTPLFYLYYSYYLYPSKTKVTLFEKLLFLPFIIFFTLTLIYRFGLIFGSDALTFTGFYLNVIRINEVFSVFFCLTFLIVPLYYAVFYKKEEWVYDTTYVRPNIAWLNVTFVLLALLTIYWGYLTYKNMFTEAQGQLSYYYLWVVLSITIYWFGYMGIYKYGVLMDRKKIRKYGHKALEIVGINQNKNKHILVLEDLLLNKKMYLDSQLTLESISKKMQLSKSHLSRIISAELQTSFTSYLNSYRVEEAKGYLNNPEFSNYTIVAIGLEAGFNSRSSFFDVFKKVTGKIPSAYKKEFENHLKIESS